MEYPGNLMGLGYMGVGAGGNPSSSTSNLSAFAPPFTVDRFNPMLNSNPVFHYPEIAYDVEPFAHTSQFSGPSAPGAELDINFISAGIANIPFSDYGISASTSAGQSGSYWSAPSPSTSGSRFVYGGEVKPYYSSGVPPMIGEHDSVIGDQGWHCSNVMPSSGLNVSSQFDEPRWVDNMGFDVGKWVKSVEPVGSFSSKNGNVGGSNIYESNLSQDIPFRKMSQEVSDVPYGNLGRVSGSEVHTRTLRVGNLDDKSRLDQNFNLLPYYSTRIHTSSSSMLPESHYLGQSCEVMYNFGTSQTSYSPYQNCAMPVDSSFSSFVSSTRASPTVVIRAPPAANDIFGKNVAHKHIQNDNDAVVHCVNFDLSSYSKLNDRDLSPITDIKEDFIPLSSVKELPSPLPTRDTFYQKIQAQYGPQLPNINVCGGLPMAYNTIQVPYSDEESLDFFDHLNPVVDSPCWKGAPSSQFQAFNSGPENSFKKNLSEYHGFDREEHQNLLSFYDSSRTFSRKVGEGYHNDDNECDRNRVLMLESALDANCFSREKSLSDGAKTRVGIATMISGGVQRSDESIASRNECSFDMNFFDTKKCNVEEEAAVTPNDISEGGTVAVHAAEKVLASPPMEVVTECAKLPPDTELDLQTMIKAMHNLSELLLCSLSNDSSALQGKNTEILKNIISNLDACMRNKSKSHVSDTSEEHGKSHYVGTVLPRCDKANEPMNSQLDYQNMHGGNGNNIFFTDKPVKSPIFSPLNAPRDDGGGDDMAKAIKKVLDENFHCDEEIYSQALLFKNLWLEAEAKLCSMNYVARFDRMKIEIGKSGTYAPKENGGVIEEIKPKLLSSRDPNTSMLTLNTHDASSSKPATRNTFISSSTENAEDVGSSIMAKFNILKSREDNLKLSNTEQERQPKMVEGENAGSIMASRSNILRSRGDKVTSSAIEKEQHLETARSTDAESIMARFIILKSREDTLTSTNMEKALHDSTFVSNILRPEEGSSGFIPKEERQAWMVGGEFLGKNRSPFISKQSKDEVFNPTPKLHFSHQTGIVGEGKYLKYGSYVDGSRYAPPEERNISAVDDDPIMHPYNRMFPDSSTCSDWEHIQKDDFAWKDV